MKREEQARQVSTPYRLDELVSVVARVAREAGAESLACWEDYGRDQELVTKPDGTLVTALDRRVEMIIKQRLKELPFAFGFRSEESGVENEASPLKWIIDPIDGTRYFVCHLPFFAVVIALLAEKEDIPQLGVIYEPATRQLFHAYKDGGVHLNGRRLQRPVNVDLAKSMIYVDVDSLQKLEPDERAWVDKKLIELTHVSYRVRMFGCAALAATWFAMGAIEAFVDLTGCNPVWDMVAARMVMTEAGAREAFLPTAQECPRRRYLASNPLFFAPLYGILSS